jgi:hypothetical protein
MPPDLDPVLLLTQLPQAVRMAAPSDALQEKRQSAIGDGRRAGLFWQTGRKRLPTWRLVGGQ